MGFVRTHYLDTSVIVKLLVKESGSERIRSYIKGQTNFHATSLCFAETLGVLKGMYMGRRHKKIISEREYLDACNELMAHVHGKSISIDEEIEIATPETYREVEAIAKKYNLDIADAFQIVALKKGIFSIFRGEAKPIVITADGKLAEAANNEGLRAWNILAEPEPSAVEHPD
jgi:predicted nucleic acid-binding protein